jgi:MtN3 and saliva related transmembrane protein
MSATALGFIAATWALAMAVSPILQIREIMRRRSSAGLSVGYMLALLVGFALWVAYGVASTDWPLVVPNTIAFIVMSATTGTALRYR